MRAAILALVFLAACGQAAAPAQETPPDARAGSSGAGNLPDMPFTLEAEALVGLWSFERDCGLYDLVFAADDGASYYDYRADGAVVSYRGAWATADNNRVVLTLRRLGPDGAPTGDAQIYNVDVAAPVTDDLIGRMTLADGSDAREFTARRCPEEDRD
jgi:hypothetical protein